MKSMGGLPDFFDRVFSDRDRGAFIVPPRQHFGTLRLPKTTSSERFYRPRSTSGGLFSHEPPHPHRHQTCGPPPSGDQRNRPASEGRHQRPRCRQHHPRKRNGKTGSGGCRCRKPLDSLHRPAELWQDNASGGRLGTRPGQDLRGPALPVWLSKRPSPGLQCRYSQIERHLRKLPVADINVEVVNPAEREMRSPGTTLAQMRQESRPRATTNPWTWTKTAAICSRRRFPSLPWMPMFTIGFWPSPARLPTSTRANASSPGTSAKQSITGHWGDSFPDKEARRQCLLEGLARQLR